MSRKLPGSAIVPGTITVTQITGGLNDTTNASYAQANTARTTANDAYGQANTARDQANTARTQANTAYDQANNARGQANTAYGQANAAYDQANASYNVANTKLASAGGTLSGDLIITGNLTVSGNSTTLNTEILTVEDAEVVLLSNVASTPALNAGVIVNRGTSANTFLRWDEALDEWGWSDSGNTTYYFEDLRAGLATTNTTFGTVNTSLGTINTSYQAAYAQANTAGTNALNAYGAANNRVLKAGDTMTGQLNISSGGLLVTGNVGIGTVNPNAALEVNGNIYLSSNLNFLLLGTNSAVNPYIQGDASGQKLYIGVNNGAAITIDSSKNIGIGTTNPSQKLYVAGGSFTVENTNTFTVTPNYAGATGVPAGILVNSGNAANVTFIADAASGTANRGVNISAFSGSNWFRGLSYMNKSGTPDLILQQDGGNVGIGTTSPGNRLVVGDTSGVSTASIVAVNTTGNLGNCIEFGHTNGAGYRSTLGSHYSSGQPFLAFHAEAGTNINTFRTRGIAGSVITTNNGGALLFSRVTTASADNQSLTESMRIDASGNMYLGLTGNPSGWGSAIKYAIRQASASGYTGFVSFASGNDHAIAVGHDGTKGMVGVSYATGSYTPLTFQTGGTDRITIDTAGSVGINQTSPGTARLYVKGQGSSGFNTIFEDPVASGYCWIQIKATGGGSNSSWQIGTYQSGLQFYNDNNSAYRVFFGDNGNVGIGTTSPSTKLHLYESGTADVLLRLTSANGTYDPLIQFTGQGNDITAEGFEIWYDNDVGDVHLSTTYPNDAATIHFHTRTGASKSTSNERLTILGNGNVGIGKTSPTGKLHIYDTSNQSGDATLYIESPSSNDWGIKVAKTGYDFGIIAEVDSSASYGISIYAGSSYVFRATGGGNLLLTGTLTESSSIELKENIDPITNALDSITKLVGVTYDRKDGSAQNRAGLIAESVAKVLPNVVNGDGIQYTNLIAYLVESIKELKAEIDVLKSK